MSILDDAFVLPRPGWPGRRKAIARALVRVTFDALFFLAFVVAMFAMVVLIGTAMDALP